MTALITKSAEEGKKRGSKRVLPAHLKQAVKSNEQFDFLSDIVDKVPDAPPPSSRGKGPNLDDDSGEEEVKRKRPGRRKKTDMND
jgi:Dr1-associated corepressor